MRVILGRNSRGAVKVDGEITAQYPRMKSLTFPSSRRLRALSIVTVSAFVTGSALAILSCACRAQDEKSATAGANSTPPESTQPNAPQPNAPPKAATEAATGSATGEESTDPNAVTFNFESDLVSRYVFRGVASSGGPVVQSGLYASKRGYTLGLWGNLNATRRRSDRRGFNEFDVTFSKSIERGKTTVEPGLLLYLYPRGEGPNTGEVSLRLSRRLGKIVVFNNNYVDFKHLAGAYFGDVGVSREYTFNPKLSGEAKLSVGFASAKYNAAFIGPRKNALDVLALDLSMTYALSERFYLRPHLGVTRLLDSELRQSVDDSTLFTAGIAAGSDF